MSINDDKRRRPGVHYGRRLLERERFQITDPLPPAPVRDAKPVGNAIAKALARLQGSLATQTRQQNRITPLWENLIPPELRDHCRRGPFEDGYLVLYVENTLWLDQVRRFHARRMETLLRERLGPAFQRLVLRLDPQAF